MTTGAITQLLPGAKSLDDERDKRGCPLPDGREALIATKQSSPRVGELEGETVTRDQVVRRRPEPNETATRAESSDDERD